MISFVMCRHNYGSRIIYSFHVSRMNLSLYPAHRCVAVLNFLFTHCNLTNLCYSLLSFFSFSISLSILPKFPVRSSQHSLHFLFSFSLNSSTLRSSIILTPVILLSLSFIFVYLLSLLQLFFSPSHFSSFILYPYSSDFPVPVVSFRSSVILTPLILLSLSFLFFHLLSLLHRFSCPSNFSSFVYYP